jgi:hypothetical protein
MGENDRWMTRKELATRLGLPEKTPAQWARNGQGRVTPARATRPLPLKRRNRLGTEAFDRRCVTRGSRCRRVLRRTQETDGRRRADLQSIPGVLPLISANQR